MNFFGNRNPPTWHQTPFGPPAFFPQQLGHQIPPVEWQLHTGDRTSIPLPANQPHLNPALATETTNIRYDVRKPARKGINSSLYQQVSDGSAFAEPTREVRIISKAFPWSVDVRVPRGSTVTCKAIYEGLYMTLQEPIVDSEWAIALQDKPKKEAIEKAAKARKEKETHLKRVDWLGENTIFKGLERDKEFEKKRRLQGSQVCKETWVAKFGKP